MAATEVKYSQWLRENGFNENEITYVYFPDDSYEIKDTLKQIGFIYNTYLYWHSPVIIEGYEDKVIPIKLEDVAETCAWGTSNYYSDAKEKVFAAMKQARPQKQIKSQWVGSIGERLKDISVTIVLIHGFQSKYGFSQIVKFEDNEGNFYSWFTTVNLTEYSVGEQILLTGTIKSFDNDKYNDNAPITVLNRCKIKAV